MSEEREARNEVDEWIATAAWHLGKNVLTIDEKRIAYFAWRECQERNTRAQSSQAERVKELEAENARLREAANNLLRAYKELRYAEDEKPNHFNEIKEMQEALATPSDLSAHAGA